MSDHQDTIVAFTQQQRSFHNHLLHFMIFFIITGLPLLSPSFSFLGWLFALPYDFFRSVFLDLATSGLTDNERLAAGLQVARVIDRLTALFFIIMAIPFVAVQLVQIRKWSIWPEDRWSLAAFFEGIKGLWINYVSFGHVRIGKFNVGQKLFAWTTIMTMLAITASGLGPMFREHFPQGVQEFSRLVHAASFVIIAVFRMVQFYLGLIPMNRQLSHAMFGDGTLPVDYVRSHHPIWYENLTGQKRPDPIPAENEEQLVIDEKLENILAKLIRQDAIRSYFGTDRNGSIESDAEGYYESTGAGTLHHVHSRQEPPLRVDPGCGPTVGFGGTQELRS